MVTEQRVIREANLIARQFECLGEDAASTATANHVRLFWAPLLRSELELAAREHPDRFSAIARRAIRALESAPARPAQVA